MKKIIACFTLISCVAIGSVWGLAEWSDIKKKIGKQEEKAITVKVNAATNEVQQKKEIANSLDLKNQEAIQERMLNSYQFFNSVKGSFHYASKDVGFDYTVNYQLKWKNKMVKYYVKTVENNKNAIDELSYDAGELKTIYPNVKKYEKIKLDIKNKGEFKKIGEVVVRNSDGTKEYRYPETQLYLGMAENSLHSKEIAVGFLEEKNLWTVKRTEQLLGRQVVVIEGTLNPYYQEKLMADTFTLWMDQSTGILMKYETIRNGEIIDLLETTNIKIDEEFEVETVAIPTTYDIYTPGK